MSTKWRHILCGVAFEFNCRIGKTHILCGRSRLYIYMHHDIHEPSGPHSVGRVTTFLGKIPSLSQRKTLRLGPAHYFGSTSEVHEEAGRMVGWWDMATMVGYGHNGGIWRWENDGNMI